MMAGEKISAINRLRRSASFTSLFSNKSRESANGRPSNGHEGDTAQVLYNGKKRKRASMPNGPLQAKEQEGDDDDGSADDDYTTPSDRSTGDVESISDEEDEQDAYESDGGRLESKRPEKHVAKKRRQKGSQTEEELAAEEALVAFEKREQELDEALPPQYRKLRPRGFGFNIPPTDRPVRIYADGVFDLFHLGHMRQLEQSKKSLPNVTLICGIPSDVETHRRKGLTVLTDTQRLDTLKHCKWVDEVIPNAPWCVTPEFLEKHQIDYVAHDDLPYASGNDDDIYKPIKEMGKFLTTQRTEGISTSDIITKIIRDYDKYLMRNFARGASRQELNVSWFKKNELDLKRHVMEFRESFKNNFETASKDLYSEIRTYISNTLGNANNGGGAGGSNGGSFTPLRRVGTNGSTASSSSRKGKDKKRSTSPATDFAANFSGGEENEGRGRKRPTSFIGNVKGWMSRKSSTPVSPDR